MLSQPQFHMARDPTMTGPSREKTYRVTGLGGGGGAQWWVLRGGGHGRTGRTVPLTFPGSHLALAWERRPRIPIRARRSSSSAGSLPRHSRAQPGTGPAQPGTVLTRSRARAPHSRAPAPRTARHGRRAAIPPPAPLVSLRRPRRFGPLEPP